MRRRGGARPGGRPEGREEEDDPQGKEKRERKVAFGLLGGAMAFVLVVTFVVAQLQRSWGVENETPAASDVLLVSFPKSGSNWLRFLVVSLMARNHRAKLTFPVIEKLVPDLEFGTNRLQFRKRGRVAWKSHQPFRADPVGAAEKPTPCNMTNMEGYQCLCPNCPARWSRVVYLVRDGRSALCSYYYMQTQLGNFEGTFRDFLASPKSQYGVPWPRHVESYLGKPSVFLLKYEDLHQHPHSTLRHLHNFLAPGRALSDDDLRDVLHASDFETMRNSELADGLPLFDQNYPDARAAKGFHLVREGRLDGWTQCTDDPSLFEAHIPGFDDVMTALGYYPHDAAHH